MANDVATAGMHPDIGRESSWRIRYQDQSVPRLQPMHYLRTPGEYRPVNGGPKGFRAWKDGGHLL